MIDLKNFYEHPACKPCLDGSEDFWGTAVKVANGFSPQGYQRTEIRQILNEEDDDEMTRINQHRSGDHEKRNILLIGLILGGLLGTAFIFCSIKK